MNQSSSVDSSKDNTCMTSGSIANHRVSKPEKTDGADSSGQKPSRIIKNVFRLDTKTLKDLGIRSKICNAVSKMTATNCELKQAKQSTSGLRKKTVSASTNLFEITPPKSYQSPCMFDGTSSNVKTSKIEILSDVKLKDPTMQLDIESLLASKFDVDKPKTMTFIRGSNPKKNMDLKRLKEISESYKSSQRLKQTVPLPGIDKIQRKQGGAIDAVPPQDIRVVYVPPKTKINVKAILQARINRRLAEKPTSIAATEEMPTNTDQEIVSNESEFTPKSELFFKEQETVEFIPLAEPVQIQFKTEKSVEDSVVTTIIELPTLNETLSDVQTIDVVESGYMEDYFCGYEERDLVEPTELIQKLQSCSKLQNRKKEDSALVNSFRVLSIESNQEVKENEPKTITGKKPRRVKVQPLPVMKKRNQTIIADASTIPQKCVENRSEIVPMKSIEDAFKILHKHEHKTCETALRKTAADTLPQNYEENPNKKVSMKPVSSASVIPQSYKESPSKKVSMKPVSDASMIPESYKEGPSKKVSIKPDVPTTSQKHDQIPIKIESTKPDADTYTIPQKFEGNQCQKVLTMHVSDTSPITQRYEKSPCDKASRKPTEGTSTISQNIDQNSSEASVFNTHQMKQDPVEIVRKQSEPLDTISTTRATKPMLKLKRLKPPPILSSYRLSGPKAIKLDSPPKLINNKDKGNLISDSIENKSPSSVPLSNALLNSDPISMQSTPNAPLNSNLNAKNDMKKKEDQLAKELTQKLINLCRKPSKLIPNLKIIHKVEMKSNDHRTIDSCASQTVATPTVVSLPNKPIKETLFDLQSTEKEQLESTTSIDNMKSQDQDELIHWSSDLSSSVDHQLSAGEVPEDVNVIEEIPPATSASDNNDDVLSISNMHTIEQKDDVNRRSNHPLERSHSDASVQNYIFQRDFYNVPSSECDSEIRCCSTSSEESFIKSSAQKRSRTFSRRTKPIQQSESLLSILVKRIDRNALISDLLEFHQRKFTTVDDSTDNSDDADDEAECDDDSDDLMSSDNLEIGFESDEIDFDYCKYDRLMPARTAATSTAKMENNEIEQHSNKNVIIKKEAPDTLPTESACVQPNSTKSSEENGLNANYRLDNIHSESPTVDRNDNSVDSRPEKANDLNDSIDENPSNTSPAINSSGKRKRANPNYSELSVDANETPVIRKRTARMSTVDLTQVQRSQQSQKPKKQGSFLDNSCDQSSRSSLETLPTDDGNSSISFNEFSIPNAAPRRRLKLEPVDSIVDQTTVPTDIEQMSEQQKAESKSEQQQPPSVPKKRGRKPKNVVESAAVVEQSVIEKREPGKRGPRRKQNSLPAILPDILKCGNCQENVPQKEWPSHLLGHYGLGWIEGLEDPVDMDNINAKASLMIRYAKHKNLKDYFCRDCGDRKRSAVGYLSHLEVCGLSVEERLEKKVRCKYCPAMLRKVSVLIHEQNCCSGLRIQREEEQERLKLIVEADTQSSDSSLIDSSNRCRPLRLSAKKANKAFKHDDNFENNQDLTLSDIEKLIIRNKILPNSLIDAWSSQLQKMGHILCDKKGCFFETWTVDAMRKHYKKCRSPDENQYICKICKHGPGDRDSIRQHILQTHNNPNEIDSVRDFSVSGSDATIGEESSDSDCSSGVNEQEVLSKEDPMTSESDGISAIMRCYTKLKVPLETSSLDKKVLNDYTEGLKQFGNITQLTTEWTQSYHNQNYSKEPLYTQLMSNNVRKLTAEEGIRYKPSKQKSHQFAFQQISSDILKTKPINGNQWKTLDSYGTINGNDSHNMFCGGPVISFDWIPLPDDYLKAQYLAVCCKNDPAKTDSITSIKTSKCSIQIWCLDHLKNIFCDNVKPKLCYCVAYDYGPIFDMKFCPSGGLSDERLGLLAVPSNKGQISILSLPLSTSTTSATVTNSTCDNENNLMFTVEPSLILSCKLNDIELHVNRIEWAKEIGHSTIVAGYNNGLVAIWNLNNLSSTLLCHSSSTKGGIKTLLPHQVFYAFSSVISQLNLHHDLMNNSRWLAVGGFDRKIKFYDLQQTDPIEVSLTVQKSRVINGCWPLNWTLFYSVTDDAYSLGSGATIRQPLDIGSRISSIYQSVGHTCDISFSDWLNIFIFVNDYGTIHAAYPAQMISAFLDANRRIRAVVGFTDVIFDGGSTALPSITKTENGTKKNVHKPQSIYVNPFEQNIHSDDTRIVFYDNRYPLQSRKTPLDDARRTPIFDSSINLHKINKVAFNPNANTYKCYALGYENGFVRIMFMKSMSKS